MMRIVLAMLLISLMGLTQAKEFTSTEKATDVIELYTSEGCSSCPPADRWLTSLKDDKGLFSEFIPIAFHVDYWNYLGWEDRFSNSEFSQRQRNLARQKLVSQVYTPGFVINSQEWRAWFKGSRQWQTNQATPGVLRATLDGNRLQVVFDQKRDSVVHVAYLGLGISTDVKRGENSGRELHHDFVVLDMLTAPGKGQWELTLPGIPNKGQQQTALAIWVSPVNSSRVIQAAGGYL